MFKRFLFLFSEQRREVNQNENKRELKILKKNNGKTD